MYLRDSAGSRLSVDSELRQSVTDLIARRTVLSPRVMHVGDVTERVAVGQVFLRELRVSPAKYRPSSAAYSSATRGGYSGPTWGSRTNNKL
jgi:hypothetical protein